MFIKVQERLVNTDNITSIYKPSSGSTLYICLVNGKNLQFTNIDIDQIEKLLKNVDKIEEKPNRLEILDL